MSLITRKDTKGNIFAPFIEIPQYCWDNIIESSLDTNEDDASWYFLCIANTSEQKFSVRMSSVKSNYDFMEKKVCEQNLIYM